MPKRTLPSAMQMLALSMLVLGMSSVFAGTPQADVGRDDYAWLEKPRSPEALAWSATQTARTRAALLDGNSAALRAGLFAARGGADSLPYVFAHGKYLYTWARDASHPRGVLRRATASTGSIDAAAWTDLLDVDALAKRDGKAWAVAGGDIECLPPAFDRCLIPMSPDGGDGVILREFDARQRRFVTDGFNAPLARTSARWADADHLLIATDFGPASLDTAGYPRQVRLWTRGTPLASARMLVEGGPTDSAEGFRDNAGSTPRNVFYVTGQNGDGQVLIQDDADRRMVALEVPPKATYAIHGDWLSMLLKDDWRHGGDTFASGSLLVANLPELKGKAARFQAVFTPHDGESVVDVRWARSHLVYSTLRAASTHIFVVGHEGTGPWSVHELNEVPPFNFVELSVPEDADRDDIWLRVRGLINPGQLLRASLTSPGTTVVAAVKPAFDTSGLVVTQHFARSDDGTSIPYFEVARKDIVNDGTHPTLMYGYGGFGVPVVPLYHPEIGVGWLARGGVYISTNIRGGSEFGPAWHTSAIRENKSRSYEDFAAVARDVVRRGVTSPRHLGAFGSSNGGLLIGNMLTTYPELFGALVSEVPVLDLRNYVRLGAGPSWIDEYGNPDLPADWAFMKKISPYHNVAVSKPYPPVLFTTATSDDRVGPGQARKMAAKLQALGYKDVWFFEGDNGGHGGVDRDAQADLDALMFGFFWKYLQ